MRGDVRALHACIGYSYIRIFVIRVFVYSLLVIGNCVIRATCAVLYILELRL
jgi:hypothetical protein